MPTHRAIGRTIAVGFAKESAHVAVNFRDDVAGVWESLRLVTAAGRRGAVVHQADVGDPAAVEELFSPRTRDDLDLHHRRRPRDELGPG